MHIIVYCRFFDNISKFIGTLYLYNFILTEVEMDISTSRAGSTLYVYFDGELDQSAADRIRADLDKAVNSQGLNSVVFDVSKLRFMDSTGVGLIMGRYKKLREKNVRLCMTKPNQQIDKVLRLSGLYNIIPVI